MARPMGQSNIIEPKLMMIMFIIYIWFVSSIGGQAHIKNFQHSICIQKNKQKKTNEKKLRSVSSS